MSTAEVVKTLAPSAANEVETASFCGQLPKIVPLSSPTPLRARTSQQTPLGGVTNANNEKVETPATTAAATINPTTSAIGTSKGKMPPKPPEEFYKDLHQFHERRGTSISHLHKINGREVDLHRLYSEVTERGGFLKVNMRDEWDEILPLIGLREKCVNASAVVKSIYRRCLEKYERLFFFGEDPDKLEALEVGDLLETSSRSRSRYPSSLHSSSSGVNAVPMMYNYRQHYVTMDRRRQYKLSTDLHKPSIYEKLMLSLISPLPNEQDFAINVCTVIANHTQLMFPLKDYPKLLDALMAHAGVFSDYSLRKLFQKVYKDVRGHSLVSFWRDLLHEKPHILELYTDDHTLRSIVDDVEDFDVLKPSEELKECLSMDFFNLKRDVGLHEFIGQRVQQILGIFRSFSHFEVNAPTFARNRTIWRLLVMGANVRWGNIHNQALEITGNIANEIELLDPTTDDLSRSLMATVCDGIESPDRAVVINCLEILCKLCQKDGNEEHIHKCLNLKFYEVICSFLCLNDIMLLVYTLEAIYSLTSMGARSCHLLMQVRGIVDQLVSLITVEGQSYGREGCIQMRVVETITNHMASAMGQKFPAHPPSLPVYHTGAQQPVQGHGPDVQGVNAAGSSSMPAGSPREFQNLALNSQSQAPLPQAPAATPTKVPTSNLASPEDEQYALAWLGATFERAGSNESHVEQQELYRMYLAHCQRFGKHSVVTHLQFPRLVRLIFSSTVGPVVIKRADGTELPGLHYVAIRVRAQPLPIQSKPAEGKILKAELTNSVRKVKKKLKSQPEQGQQGTNQSPTQPQQQLQPQQAQQQPQPQPQPQQPHPQQQLLPHQSDMHPEVPSPQIQTKAGVNDQKESVEFKAFTKITKIEPSTSNIQPSQTPHSALEQSQKASPSVQNTVNVIVQPLQTQAKLPLNESSEGIQLSTIVHPSHHQLQLQPPPAPSPSLAPQQYVLQQQQSSSQPTSSLIKSLLATKVTQRQQKQKDLTVASAQQTHTPTTVIASAVPHQVQQQQQPIKVASTAISALVNNPLMQNTPVKVGQTTIKPLNPQIVHVEKKPQMEHSAPPPLAPLSGSNVAKDVSGRTVIIANQMLVDILDKKANDPPIPANIIKRKIDDVGDNSSIEAPKRLALDGSQQVGVSAEEFFQVTPSKNAANLYAEMAASILEDEDLEDLPPMSTQTQQQLTTTSTMTTDSRIQPQQQQPQSQPQQLLLSSKIQPSSMGPNVQRQLVFQPTSQGPQLKIAQTTGGQQIPTAMATIKTDQGLQTVPVILQQKPMEPTQPQIIQQVIQQHQQQNPTAHQQTTQYVLATNQQGQTYLVAQQSQAAPPPPPATQTLLVTQTPQQQSAGTKTIIILQQQTLPGQQSQPQIITSTAGGGMTTQKMIITPQGQQVLVTQRSASQQSTQPPQQIFINAQTGALQTQRQIIQSPALGQPMHHQSQQHQLQQQQQLSQQSQTGHISPSLLSQISHIPATIKLHQPSQTAVIQHHHSQSQTPGQAGQATISRIGKSVSIVQAGSQTPIQIPQLQQHPSIIQQHIVSGPPEKRQVIVGGRAIEIKETVITQAQPAPQQTQLNSQTIITTQQPQLLQHQHQQHQTISMTQQQGLQPGQILLTQTVDDMTNFIQTKAINQPQTMVQTIIQQPTHGTIATIKKPNVPIATMVRPSHQQSMALPSQHQQQQQQTLTFAAKVSLPSAQSSVQQSLLANTMVTTTASSPGGGSMQSRQGGSMSVVAASASGGKLQQQQQHQETTPSQMSNQGASSTTSTLSTSSAPSVGAASTVTTSTVASAPAAANPATAAISSTAPIVNPPSQPSQPAQPAIDPNWPYICDWRNCPRRKYKSFNHLQHHVCTEHCPDNLDPAAEIFCQWGAGPTLCDHVPRKRYALMTHLIDRHLTTESLRSAVQRRIATGTVHLLPTKPPVTIIRNVEAQRGSTASPALSTSSSSSNSMPATGSGAMQAIKRHTAYFANAKEMKDENEGPVTKSIRLTAALIVRNLVTYNDSAKRSLRRYESLLANVALSNVESSGVVSHILYELDN